MCKQLNEGHTQMFCFLFSNCRNTSLFNDYGNTLFLIRILNVKIVQHLFLNIKCQGNTVLNLHVLQRLSHKDKFKIT